MRTGRRTAVAAMLVVGWLGCKRDGATTVASTPAQRLTERLHPAQLVAALRKAGGAEVTGTLSMRVAATETSAGLNPPQELDTESVLQMDRSGNFSLQESNNLDNGRVVVLHNDTLSVQLKYGKLVSHPAREPEPTNVLQEALGGPFTVWELLATLPDIVSERTEAGTIRYTIKPGVSGTASPGAGPLRSWRQDAVIQSGGGEIIIDETSHLPSEANLTLTFSAARNKHPVNGKLAVRFSLKKVGAVPELGEPDAGALQTHQRTLGQERMLDGLSGRRDPAQITP